LSDYIGGFAVVSGGVVVVGVDVVGVEVLVVSVVVVPLVPVVPVVVGVLVVVESVPVLSDEPDTFLVELHADVANIIDPATARLKIIFFIE
jgi:hypothetical protein